MVDPDELRRYEMDHVEDGCGERIVADSTDYLDSLFGDV